MEDSPGISLKGDSEKLKFNCLGKQDINSGPWLPMACQRGAPILDWITEESSKSTGQNFVTDFLVSYQCLDCGNNINLKEQREHLYTKVHVYLKE